MHVEESAVYAEKIIKRLEKYRWILLMHVKYSIIHIEEFF